VRVLALGGDHSISAALVQGLAAQAGPLAILHLDAHPDLYDELDGSRHSHACPFARIMEAGAARTLVQAGIRTLNPHQQAQAERFGVEIFEAKEWAAGGAVRLENLLASGGALSGAVYLSIDLDVLDPAFAPGVSHHEPGGLSTRDLLELIHALPGPILGADIVELNPSRDPLGITAAAAAKLAKEVLGRMLEG
jgi:agmatinase